MDSLIDDDKTSDIPAYFPDLLEELREAHLELLKSVKNLINIQSEDEDED